MKKSFLQSFTTILILIVLSGCIVKEEFGYLSISSDPQEAIVFLDGDTVGKTNINKPLNLTLKPGSYLLCLYLDGYKPYEEEIYILKNKTTTIAVTLEPLSESGYLSISSDTDEAQIYLNNQFYGLTKANQAVNITLSPGKYQLKIIKGQLEYEKEIEILKDTTLALKCELQFKVTIAVDTQNAEIFYWRDQSTATKLDYPVATSLGLLESQAVFKFNEPGVYWFYAKKSGRVFSAEVAVLPLKEDRTINLKSVPVSVARSDENTLIQGKALFAPWELENFVSINGSNPYQIYVAKYYLYFGSQLGITGDWAYCQSIHETGWFKFGGDVPYTQNNYAGLGATGGGNPGNYFNTPEEGVLAQIQHLWAYGLPSSSGDPFPVKKYPLLTDVWGILDKRYGYVKRPEKFESWVYLNGRWAVPGTTYAQRIRDLHNSLMNYLGY